MRHDPGLHDLPEPLRRVLAGALAEPPERVRRVAAGAQAVWLKRAEQLSLRWRLQKGDGRRAFEADRAGLHDLAALGLPVAPIVAEGEDFFATADVGRPLSGLLADPAQAGPGRIAGFTAAGAALAALHRAGVAHGRPSVRDICWDGGQARFIDLERYRPGRAGRGRMALDVLILLHSMLAISRAPGPELAAALAGWRAGAPAGLAEVLEQRVRRLGWLGWLARQVLRWKPTSREVAAVPMLLDWMRGPGRDIKAP